MKIIIIEDNIDYRRNLIDFLREMPSVRESDLIYPETGLYKDTENLLADLTALPLGEKTVLIVDGTLNYTKGQSDGIAGNGFGLVKRWIEELTKERNERMLENLGIILNTRAKEHLRDDFPPYASLQRLCQEQGVFFTENSGKGSKEMVELIQDFEGGRPPLRER